MLAKITIFIWAPQYVTERFATDATVGGTFMSNVFTTALLGSIAGTWLVTRIKVSYLVYGFVGLSLLSAALLTQLDSLSAVLMLAFAYGLSVSATFNAFVAFSLTQVRLPTHRNIAYMLLMSSSGSALAPLVSSRMVEWQGELTAALSGAVALLSVVMVLLLAVETLNRALARPAGQPDGLQ
jgi:fucose permease